MATRRQRRERHRKKSRFVLLANAEIRECFSLSLFSFSSNFRFLRDDRRKKDEILSLRSSPPRLLFSPAAGLSRRNVPLLEGCDIMAAKVSKSKAQVGGKGGTASSIKEARRQRRRRTIASSTTKKPKRSGKENIKLLSKSASASTRAPSLSKRSRSATEKVRHNRNEVEEKKKGAGELKRRPRPRPQLFFLSLSPSPPRARPAPLRRQ